MDLGRLLILFGILCILGGAVIYFFPNILSWLGNLPGDIRILKGRSKIFIPITTMVVVSILMTIIINFILWLIKIMSK